jgi:hypothetical protein
MAKDTRQMGKMITIEDEKTSVSVKSSLALSRGTSSIPPPAPKRPLTAPAAKPANVDFIFRYKKSPPLEVYPGEAILFCN